jgi:two-component system, cell cycle sensor histidine kinase and response regulator CckA
MSRAKAEAAGNGEHLGTGIERLIWQLRRRVAEVEAQNRDLTEELADLRRDRARAVGMFEAIPFGYCVLDLAGTILEANPSAIKLLGLRPRECVGLKLGSLLSERDAAAFARHLRDVLWAGTENVHGIDLDLKDARRAAGVRLVSLEGEGAAPCLRYVVSVSGTSAAPTPEDDSRLRQIAAHVEDAYYEVDAEGSVIYLSSAYERIWCRGVSQARERHWFDSVHPDDLRAVQDAWRLLLQGDPFDEEYRIVRPDGELRWVRDRASLVEHGSARVVGVARDVTDDRALDEELKQAQKLEALGTLASGVAHDFGNLLQGVMGCLSFALSETTSAERARDHTRQALIAVRGGASLVGQLMKFGRKDRVQTRPMQLDSAITGCAKLLQRLVGDHIELQIQAEAAGATILGDPVQIEQILMNLAANARDAMPGGGRLVIRTQKVMQLAEPGSVAHPCVQLEVCDVGCGMDRETQARLFEPFFTTKAAGKGTGLGLAAVKAVTRSLGGHVTVESTVGQGTAFVFRFPCVDSPPVSRKRPAAAVMQFGGRVLLVEDDWRVRISIRQYLEALGFDVVEAVDADDAMARAHGELALVVADVVLPEVSGPRLVGMLKGKYPDLKALYMSAHPAPYLVEQRLLRKSDRVLQKPFEAEALARQLSELCGAPALKARASTGD